MKSSDPNTQDEGRHHQHTARYRYYPSGEPIQHTARNRRYPSDEPISERDEVGDPVAIEEYSEYQNAAGGPMSVTDGGQAVVARPGDGALSQIEHKQDDKPDERVNPFVYARTTIHPKRGDHNGDKVDEEKYDRLWRYNSHWDDDSTGRRTHKDKVCVAEALASTLDLSKSQTNRVRGIAAHMNARQFNDDGGIEGLALGAIAYVSDQDAKSFEDRIARQDRFEQLCDQHGVDGRAARKKVKQIYHGMDDREQLPTS
jgi:hypothetical protein